MSQVRRYSLECVLALLVQPLEAEYRPFLHVRDLACLSREERQELYGDVLKENGGCMTPTQVKEELERRGMTFAFVGQDMAVMRTMPCIRVEGRGQYRWNSKFSSVSETRKPKRQRSPLKEVDTFDVPPKKEVKGKARSCEETKEEEEGLMLLLSIALCELDAQPPSFHHVCRREVT